MVMVHLVNTYSFNFAAIQHYAATDGRNKELMRFQRLRAAVELHR